MVGACVLFFFFFSSRRRHTRCSRDWSSDVCSSDLRCRDGGWNCGNPNVLSFDLPSYPETTALALIGLQGRNSKELAVPLQTARRFRQETKSSLAKAWLAIALRCHGDNADAPANEGKLSNDVMLTAIEALGNTAGNYKH